jgi:hypothetical protein
VSAKAIPTHYAGCHFRSRLEARWAVFFDSLGIAWQYEPQGFLVTAPTWGDERPDERPYLPDFRLPDLDVWVEVKGDPKGADWVLYGMAVEGFAVGLPDSRLAYGCGGSALLILGDIPRLPETGPARHAHVLVSNAKGSRASLVSFANFPSDHWGAGWGATAGIFDGTWNGWAGDWEWYWGAAPAVDGYAGAGDPLPARVTRAYRRARSARFEHGQRGA